MALVTPGGEYQHTPAESVFPRSTDVLHETVQDHVRKCDQCRRAVEGKPKGFGEKSDMCPEYFRIHRMFSEAAEL